MSELHTVVCVKVVPKPEEIRVDPETHWLTREGVRSEINPPDMNALEVALRLKDLYGGRISILSMAPEFALGFLRVGLAMGSDQIYLLSDRQFAGADTLATTYTLAKGIEKLGVPDLIICGEESSDGATGQVPAGLAEWLDLPQITIASGVWLDLAANRVQGRREIQGGYEVLESGLPSVLSIQTACNEPRFMDYSLKAEAFASPAYQVWDAADLQVDPEFIGQAGSPTIVAGLDSAESRARKRQRVGGTPKEIAAQLAAILIDQLDLV
jgi:electron transfer flavoprotein beta subunit